MYKYQTYDEQGKRHQPVEKDKSNVNKSKIEEFKVDLDKDWKECQNI